MADNIKSTILKDHRRVFASRFILALLNFIAVFATSIITLYFVSRRGASGGIVACIWACLVINVLQIGLLVADFVIKKMFGMYTKWIPIASYSVGGLWLLSLLGQMLFGTLDVGTMRTDLLVIVGIQAVVAFTAYVVWPMLDRKALDAMTSPSVREHPEKVTKKSKRTVALYSLISVAVILTQVASLISYKMPPTFYDLFSDTRAIEYTLNEEGNGYIVTSIYRGTSQNVCVPATFNNKPVIGIAKGALVDDELFTNYKVTSITFGTETTDESGATVLESNLQYIEDGAIVNDNITSLTIPSSVTGLGSNAITSTSLTTLQYEARADFDISYLQNCSALSKIVMANKNVGKISSLDGMSSSVVIEVAKDIYNEYRKDNFEYVKSFRPILEENEFCVDFFTDCDYYIDSIFSKSGQAVKLSYTDLYNESQAGTALRVDTIAYIKDNNELGTDGAKADSAFRGWYFDQAFNEECEFTENDTVSINSSVSLYAKWIPEYHADLDWGTYRATNAKTKLYWTDEDVVSLPVVADRVGYKNGIEWKITALDKIVTDTYGLKENMAFSGTWILDKPVIDIEPTFSKGGENINDKNNVQFVYDEDTVLGVMAEHSHGLDGVAYQGEETYYTYNWVKENSQAFSNTKQSFSIQNVADGGNYTLQVTVHSPYGETATENTGINVVVDRKPLDMGTASLTGDTVIYNGARHTLEVDGAVASSDVGVAYEYYLGDSLVAENDGVVRANIGNEKYKVVAKFSKNNPREAANYKTETLEANLKVSPKPLTYVGWSLSEVTYDGIEHKTELLLDGLIGSDTANVVYEENSNVATNADSYIAVATGIANTDYSLTGINTTDLRKEWKINQKEVSVDKWIVNGDDWSGNTVVYDGTEHSVTAVLFGAVSGDQVAFTYNTKAEFSNKATNAGKYKAQIVGVDNDNYFFNTESTYEWEITKKALTVGYSGNNLTYNAGKQGITATIGGFATSDVDSFVKDDFNYEGKSENVELSVLADSDNNEFEITFKALNAGSYDVAIKGLSQTSSNELLKNYTLSASNSSFTIHPQTIGFEKESYEYNGSEQELYVKVTGVFASDVESLDLSQFDTTATDCKEVGGKFALVYKGTNAGDYPVQVNSFNYTNTNYKFDGTLSDNITINKKALTVKEWKIYENNKGQDTAETLSTNGSYEYNYHGYTVKAVIEGVIAGETIAETYTNNNNKLALDGAYYTTTVSIDAGSNYEFNTANSSIDWRIYKKTLELTWLVDNEEGTSFVYNGKNQTVSVKYEVLGDDEVVINLDGDTSVKDADDAYHASVLSISGEDASNYYVDKREGFSWAITQKAVTVTWPTEKYTPTYNAKEQGVAFTVDGICDEDKDDSWRIHLWYGNGDYGDVNYYVAIDGTDSYSFKAKDAKEYTVRAKSIVDNMAVANNNYYVVENEYTFTIESKMLTISGWQYNNEGGTGVITDGAEVTYNSKYYTVTATLSGVEEGDVVNLSYDEGSAVSKGDYTTKIATWSNTNYKMPSDIDVTWTILPKAVVLSWSPSQTTFTYNQGNTFTISNPTFETTSDFTNANDGKAYEYIYFTVENTSATEAGSYTATVQSITNGNYVIASSSVTECAWVINPAVVTFTWEDSSIVYNGTEQYPSAYYSYYNYATRKTTVVNATTYSGHNNVNAGSYKVTATEIDNNNFVIPENAEQRSRNYTIAKRVLEYSWKIDNGTNFANIVYDGKEKTVIPSATNVVPGDTVTLTYTSNKFTNANVGNSYMIKVTGNTNDNYTFEGHSSQVKEFNIKQKPITLEWTWDGSTIKKDFTYDGNSHGLTAKVVGAVTGDTFAISYSGVNSFVNKGEYSVAVSSLGNDNYTYTNISQKIKINPQPVKITWSGSTSVTYDGNSHTLTATVKGADDGKFVDFNYNTSYGNSFIHAGEHTATVYSLNDSNYTLDGTMDKKAQTITIAKKVVNIEWSGDTNVTYDGNNHYLSAQVSNKIGSDSVSLTVGYEKGINTYGQVSEAGTYKAKVTYVNNSNYRLPTSDDLNYSSISKEMTIAPQKVKITWPTTTEYTYTGSAITSYKPTVVGYTDNKTVSYTLNSETRVNAGNYTVEVMEVNNSNYTLNDADGNVSSTFTILPKEIIVSWSDDIKVYNGKYQNPSINMYTSINYNSVYFNATAFQKWDEDLGKWVDVDEYNAKDVGEYKYRVVDFSCTSTSYAKNNFVLPIGASTEVTLTITQKSVSLNSAWRVEGLNTTVSNSYTYEVEYDGSEHGLYNSVYNSSDASLVGAIKYEIVQTNGGYSGSEISTQYTNKAVNAGYYTIRVTGFENENCIVSGTYSVYMRIKPKVLYSYEGFSYTTQPMYVGDVLTAQIEMEDGHVEELYFDVFKNTYSVATKVTEYVFTEANVYSFQIKGFTSGNYSFYENKLVTLGSVYERTV